MTPSAPVQAPETVAIGICTFKRPELLRRALEHIAASAAGLEPLPVVIVVDNDGSDPRVAQVATEAAQVSGLTIEYHVERTPGISAARNAVFARAYALGARFLAMVDDDEWPAPQWLREMLATQRNTQAVVVGGPVDAVFREDQGPVRKYAEFWSVRSQQIDGKPFVFAAGNFLIDLAAIAAQRQAPWFDPAYGLSGGEDLAFFRSLFRDGHAMAWAANATVHEEVPDARASIDWLRRRKFRVGNSDVRTEAQGGSAHRCLLKTLGLSVRLCIYPLFRREPHAPWLGWLLEYEKVRGRYSAHLGHVALEYQR